MKTMCPHPSYHTQLIIKGLCKIMQLTLGRMTYDVCRRSIMTTFGDKRKEGTTLFS